MVEIKFSEFDERVEDVNESSKPDASPFSLGDIRALLEEFMSTPPKPAAPASEDPDRQFYQSFGEGVETPRQFEPEVYSVKSGDTLSRIAARNPFTLDQLKEANQGIDLDDIAIGQELKLPSLSASTTDTTSMPDSDEPMVSAAAETTVAPLAEETDVPTGGSMSLASSTEDLPFNMGTTTRSEDSAIFRESQKRLKSAGYYKAAVDGQGGPSTTNAIKTFQYENGLDVTGDLDEATRTKIASTDISSRPEISDSDNELLSFIGKGESGGYAAANNYNPTTGSTEFSVMDSYFSESKGKPLDQLTVAEIREIQSGGYGSREVFAVGAYQLVPDTFNETIEALGIPDDAVFNRELQDRLAVEYLSADKRPDLRDYLRGEEGVTRDEALMAFAKEWASVPIPYDITRKGQLIRRGESYYKPEGNTADAHTAEEAEELLENLRNQALARNGNN